MAHRLRSNYVGNNRTPSQANDENKSSGIGSSSNVANGSGTATAVLGDVLSQEGFFFQKRRGKVDLRGISRVDLVRVVRDVDIDTLQSHLENIAFADLTTDDLQRYSDDTFLKLFKLSQLTVEYLLNVQDSLATFCDALATQTHSAQQDADLWKSRAEIQKDKATKLKREIRQKRKSLATYEFMLTQPCAERPQAEGGTAVVAPIESSQQSQLQEEPKPQQQKEEEPADIHAPLRISVAISGQQHVRDLLVPSTHSIQRLKTTLFDDRDGGERSVRVFFRGLLLDDQLTLRQCGVGDGDTLTAKIQEAPAPESQTTEAAAAAEALAATTERKVREMEELYAERMQSELEEQQRRQEAAASDAEAQKKSLERQLNEMKAALHDMQLRDNRNPSDAAVVASPQRGGGPAVSNAGDMIDDDDDEILQSRQVVEQRMSDAALRVATLESELRKSQDNNQALSKQLDNRTKQLESVEGRFAQSERSVELNPDQDSAVEDDEPETAETETPTGKKEDPPTVVVAEAEVEDLNQDEVAEEPAELNAEIDVADRVVEGEIITDAQTDTLGDFYDSERRRELFEQKPGLSGKLQELEARVEARLAVGEEGTEDDYGPAGTIERNRESINSALSELRESRDTMERYQRRLVQLERESHDIPEGFRRHRVEAEEQAEAQVRERELLARHLYDSETSSDDVSTDDLTSTMSSTMDDSDTSHDLDISNVSAPHSNPERAADRYSG